MQFEKLLEDIVTLTPKDLFKKQEAVILENLRNKYENKCWADSYIVNIDKILLLGPTEISKNRTDGSADINVQFTVICKKFIVGSVLANCAITGLDEGKLYCQHGDNIKITCRSRSLYISPKKDQKIPVMIEKVHYGTSRSIITIIGTPYKVSKNTEIHAYGEEVFSDILRQQLTDILADTPELKETSYVKFIDNALYPYDSDPKAVVKGMLTKDFSILNFINMAKEIISKKINGVAGGYIIKHPSLHIANAEVYKLESKSVPRDSKILKKIENSEPFIGKSKFSDIICNVLIARNNYIDMLNEMGKTFTNQAAIESHQNIWDSYSKYKIHA